MGIKGSNNVISPSLVCNFLGISSFLSDLDKMIFIYQRKLQSQISVSFTFVIILITVAFVSVIYLMQIYGSKVGSSWFYSCVATLFIGKILFLFIRLDRMGLFRDNIM